MVEELNDKHWQVSQKVKKVLENEMLWEDTVVEKVHYTASYSQSKLYQTSYFSSAQIGRVSK